MTSLRAPHGVLPNAALYAVVLVVALAGLVDLAIIPMPAAFSMFIAGIGGYILGYHHGGQDA